MQLIVWKKKPSVGPLMDGPRSPSPASVALKGIDASWDEDTESQKEQV